MSRRALVALVAVNLIMWPLAALPWVVPETARLVVTWIATPECWNARAEVEYHDGMTICPGQSAVLRFQVPVARPKPDAQGSAP